MRSTLFYVPHEIGPLPILGFGWALLILGIFLALSISYRRMRGESWAVATGDWMNWAVAAAVIIFLLPRIETTFPDSAGGTYFVGLPVRGYGLMFMFGVIAAFGMAYMQASRVGWSFDQLLSLAFATLVGGIIGARLFFVIQKWSELPGDTLIQKLYEALKFTEGGLVVYGAILGALVTIISWTIWRRYRPLAVAEIVVPGFLMGLALGRIGCLMNGCCYGGMCETNLPAISFPRGSMPYIDQLISGQLLGIRTAPTSGKEGSHTITEVRPGSWADQQGLRPGQHLAAIRPELYPPKAGEDPAGAPHVFAKIDVDGRILDVTPALPKRSLPTHPAQIYATVNAALLSILLFCLWPNVRRDGIVFGLAWVMYGVSRMIEEWIRIDEAGQFGTSLSIAQWISLAGIVVGLIILIVQLQKPAGRAFQIA